MINREMLDEAVEDLSIQKPQYYKSSRQNWPTAFWRDESEDISIILGKLISWRRRHGPANVGLPINDNNLMLGMDHDIDGSDMTLNLCVDTVP